MPEGTLITIDGTGGEVVIGSPGIVTAANDPHLHRLLEWADEVSGGNSDRNEAERISAPMTSFWMARGSYLPPDQRPWCP